MEAEVVEVAVEDLIEEDEALVVVAVVASTEEDVVAEEDEVVGVSINLVSAMQVFPELLR